MGIKKETHVRRIWKEVHRRAECEDDRLTGGFLLAFSKLSLVLLCVF